MPILLLDNVFRSLDLETARTSFNRLFGEGGIIRKTGATVVLTTHLGKQPLKLHYVVKCVLFPSTQLTIPFPAVECLSLASNVIVIDKDTKTITSYKNWATETNSHLDEIPKLANLALEAASGEEDLSPPAATTAKTTNQGTENQGDPLERRLGDMSIYQFYFRSVGPLLFTTWILLAASNVVAGKMPGKRLLYIKSPSNSRRCVAIVNSKPRNLDAYLAGCRRY